MHSGVCVSTAPQSALQPFPETNPDALLAAALAACPQAVMVVEAGKILWCNSAHAQLFGYSESRELLGPITTAWAALCPPT